MGREQENSVDMLLFYGAQEICSAGGGLTFKITCRKSRASCRKVRSSSRSFSLEESRKCFSFPSPVWTGSFRAGPEAEGSPDSWLNALNVSVTYRCTVG